VPAVDTNALTREPMCVHALMAWVLKNRPDIVLMIEHVLSMPRRFLKSRSDSLE